MLTLLYSGGLGRIAAVFIKGAVDTTLDSCTMERLDGNAIMVNGFARGTVIQNCNFHEIGDNMIAQLGYGLYSSGYYMLVTVGCALTPLSE